MKKLKLKLHGKEMLSKDQMKKISGGYGGTCNFSGWIAHSNDWTAYAECTSEAHAQATCAYYGWQHYCHDSCHSSCCNAQPSFTGC